MVLNVLWDNRAVPWRFVWEIVLRPKLLGAASGVMVCRDIVLRAVWVVVVSTFLLFIIARPCLVIIVVIILIAIVVLLDVVLVVQIIIRALVIT